MNRIPLKSLLIVVVSLIAAYAGYWYYLSHEAEDYLKGRAKLWARSGFKFEFKTAEVSGFPYRLIVAIDDPRIRYENGRLALRILPEDLSIVAQPWQFDHALFFASSGKLLVEFDKRAGDDGWHFEFTGLSASARLERDRLSRLSADFTRLSGSGPTDRLLFDRLQYHWRDAENVSNSTTGLLEPPIAEFAITAKSLTRKGADQSAPQLKNLSVQLTPRGPSSPSLSPDSLAEWRDQGGTLEIDSLTAIWPGGGIAANGSVALDGEMRLLGLMSLEVQTQREFAMRLADLELFSAPTTKRIIEVLQDETGTSEISMSWQGGHAYLGTERIARVGPIFDEE